MVDRLPPTPVTGTTRGEPPDMPEVVAVRRPSAWKFLVAATLTAFGLVCVVVPGLIDRRERFPSESLVFNFGVCLTAAAAMALSATFVGWRRRRARNDARFGTG